MQPDNQEKTLRQLLQEFSVKYSNVSPLNIGSLLMASYILFVYPRQAEFDATDFSKIETSKFVVHQGTANSDKKRFCSRIRNGLTHGRFVITGDEIELCDQKNNGSDQFRSTIRVCDFGDFINGFMHEVKNQHFRRP